MEEQYIEKIIEEIELQCPSFLRASDLVKLSLFTSPAAVSVAMSEGRAPPSIKFSTRKLMFPRASLCEWLRQKSINKKVSL